MKEFISKAIHNNHMKQTSIRIHEYQEEYLDEVAINLSKFVRNSIDERMEEDGFDVPSEKE